MIRVVIPGQPQGKGRARFARIDGFVRAYTPEKTVAYEGLIALAAQTVMDGRELLSGAIGVKVQAIFQMPKGWSQKRRRAALLAPEWQTSRPDADNILKAVADGMSGIVWVNDTQIARCCVTKAYGETPGLTIIVEPLQ